MIIKIIKSRLAFTLMEILIVVALLVILATALLVTLNPMAQINKGQDSKRKHELTQLNKVFEDYYNDKGCYPKTSEICYPSTESGYNPSEDTKCYLCGNISGSPQINVYLSLLPCDPQQPTKKYLYQVDNNSCPFWYRIYTDLSLSNYVNNDPATEEVGCYSQSCGPAPDYSYDYGVSSPNIDLEKAINFAYCATSGCNACGSYQDCLNFEISKFCQGVQRIVPVASCGESNCPCQP